MATCLGGQNEHRIKDGSLPSRCFLGPKCLLSQAHFPNIDGERNPALNLGCFLLNFPRNPHCLSDNLVVFRGVLQSCDPNEDDNSKFLTNSLDLTITGLD